MPQHQAGTTSHGIVVIGGGQAGFQVAASLRDNGYDGPVRIVGDEAGLPYQRPPLSKAYLTGLSDRTALDLRPEKFFTQASISLSHGKAVAIDRTGRMVRLADGTELSYDHLVLATGARNRPLPVPGHDLAGVYLLRTAADADAFRAALPSMRRIVIVGAGFIGLEIAALTASRGIDTTVVEATGRPMSRALSPTMSEFFREAHGRAGVRFIFDAVVTRIRGDGGRVSGVETANGDILPADSVLVGIGILANDELAAAAGLETNGGIVVDDFLRTADPAISAIGDCAVFRLPFGDGARGRLESVQNAADQGRCVAARLTGKPQPYGAVPWFWSDQGPFKLQIAGLACPHETAVVRGDPASGAFSVFCFRGGKLAGVESVNKPADHMLARRLIAAAVPLTPEQAADAHCDLKRVLAGGAAAT